MRAKGGGELRDEVMLTDEPARISAGGTAPPCGGGPLTSRVHGVESPSLLLFSVQLGAIKAMQEGGLCSTEWAERVLYGVQSTRQIINADRYPVLQIK